MGYIPDLNAPIFFGGKELNTLVQSDVLVNGKFPLVGCSVDWFDPSDVEVRQFTEPLALQDGIDVGGTWQGARRLAMRGTAYDKSRGELYDRMADLESVMLPASGTFGYTPLTWYTISGAAGVLTQMTIDVRPNGLRFAVVRDEHGGEDDEPLGMRWAVTFYAKRPAITAVS